MMNGKQVPRKVKFWGLAVKYYLKTLKKRTAQGSCGKCALWK